MKWLNKILIKLLYYIINKRSVVTFTMIVDGKPVILKTKRKINHIPQINSMVYFEDIEITYKVISVAHQVTSGEKIFIGLEKIVKEKLV